MEIQLLDSQAKVSREFTDLLHNFPWSPNLELVSCYDAFGCYEGGRMIGWAIVDDSSKYFPSSIRISSWGFDWRHNTESNLRLLLTEIQLHYPNASIVCMDVHQRDLNRSFYAAIGFRDSIMVSPIGKKYSVMILEQSSSQ